MKQTVRRVSECRTLLLRASALSRKLEPGRLAWKPDGLGFGAIGAQFRHIVAYYGCFLRGVEARRIDYDDRARDLDWEHDPVSVAEEIERIAESLDAIESYDDHEPLEVLMDEPGAPATAWTRSSLGRELRFLASHAIHHLALIELMLAAQGAADRERPWAGIGFAPSTPRRTRGGERS